MSTNGDLRNTELHISPDGLLTITAAHAPSTHVHQPDSVYCRYFVVPIIGAAPWATWARLVEYLPDNDTDQVGLVYDELARSLGNSPGRFTKTLQRLVSFHLIDYHPDTPHVLFVRRRAPNLSPANLARLTERCPTLAASHHGHHHPPGRP